MYTLAFLVLAVFSAMTAVASAAESVRTTFLFSRSIDGGIPNGASRNGAISHDQRIGRVAAYESDATNIVAGDTNGVTDVFIVNRAAPWGNNGTPWTMSAATLASTGLGGVPANGASYKPSIDGSSHTKPSCVAFISTASNLVAGDTNGKPDAFVRDLANGKITRVSVNSDGKQSNGETFDVSVSGDCARVAFTSNATNLNQTDNNPAWRSAKTKGSTGGKKQVFVHVRKGKKNDKGFVGLTFVASSNKKGKPANGDSYEPSFARAGKAVVFTSSATNLHPGDRGAQTDVFERSFTRYFTHVGGKGVQTFDFDTKLVSSTLGGRAGNGASSHPTVTDDGRYIAYETLASDLLAGDTNGVSDISRADVKNKRVKQEWVSKSYQGIGNGASNRPMISGAAEFVLFDSESTIFKPSAANADDANGVRDMFLWNAPTRNTSLESRDWQNGYLAKESKNPAQSSRGNYVLFESSDSSIDQLIRNLTGIQQVYLRYLGPK